MTRPQDFGFDEAAQMLRDTARQLFKDRLPTEALHRLVAADPEPARARECVWDPSLWRRMVELGWTGVAAPEHLGGSDMGLAAVAGLAEEVGRAAVPSPLISTLCAAYVLKACGGAAEPMLAAIVEGDAFSLAIMDRRGSFTDTEVTSAGSLLDGTAWFVQDAAKAAAFVVMARSTEGVGLYVVRADAPGVTVVADAIIDLTRDQAHVVFNNAEATYVGSAQALQAAEPAILVLLAADMVGAAEWQLQTTAEYARTRVQFDRPIGFFQAVKHPLVDMMIEIDAARSLVYDAACAVDHEPAMAETCARMAKSAASDAAAFCSGRSVQLHGGIGFTWECFVQIYFKRQKHSEALFGDGAYQRARLADLLIGRIGGA
jgi:alkylation response protein AidB-like acyl-CoA dehydrogenase